jgi:hypothetical protein
VAFRRSRTRMSSTTPCWSTARPKIVQFAVDAQEDPLLSAKSGRRQKGSGFALWSCSLLKMMLTQPASEY